MNDNDKLEKVSFETEILLKLGRILTSELSNIIKIVRIKELYKEWIDKL